MVTANHDGINFLSNKWKWVSLTLVVLLVVFYIYTKLSHVPLLLQSKPAIRLITFNVLILAFVIDMLTKEKYEENVTNKMRIDSMAFAFITAIFYNIVSVVFDFIHGVEPEIITSTFFLIYMVLLFYGSFYLRRLLLWIKLRRERKF